MAVVGITIEKAKNSPSATPSSMKLLRHLLAGAVCIAVLATATVSAQPVDENVAKQLRGPDENYGKADLFPSPEHNFDSGEPDENDDEGVLPPGAGDDDEREPGLEPGEDPVIPTDSEQSDGELPSDNGSEGELDLTEETEDDLIELVDKDTGEADPDILYVRRLRSSFGFFEINIPTPPTEVAKPPKSSNPP